MEQQELSESLLQQLQVISYIVDKCKGDRPALDEFRYNLHSIALEQGIGRFCHKNRWKGIRRGELKQCFKNASHLAIHNDRYIYCEGYAIRPALTFVIGLHAWVLDRESNWEVIDPTWRNTANGVYLGVPFSHKYLIEQIMQNKIYGLIDIWQKRWPVLRDDPINYLHEDADKIPKDF